MLAKQESARGACFIAAAFLKLCDLSHVVFGEQNPTIFKQETQIRPSDYNFASGVADYTRGS